MDAGYIGEECRKMNDQLVRWRRHLHQIPEIGIDLPETETMVRGVLEELGVEFQPGYEGIGVLGLIRGEGVGQGPTVGLRADMDALEIKEESGCEYASHHPGKMHACGHDAHMAIALGAAKFFSAHQSELGGTVKLIFQPGEERMDGARRMIEAGALDNPRVDMILGLHIGGLWEELGPGQVGVSHLPIMAAADSFEFSIVAPGGHGAAPHQSPDPVLAACSAITQIHTLVGRGIDPTEAAVISIGVIRAGQARNVIPTEVTAQGTVRTLNEPVRRLLEKRIAQVLAHTAQAFGCSHSYAYFRDTSPVRSDQGITDLVACCASELFGKQAVIQIRRPSMAGEDVSLLLGQAPGCFFGLGASNPARGVRSYHHSPIFDIDESVLWRGVALLSLATLRWLEDAR